MKKSMTIIIGFLCALSLSAQVNFNNNTVNAGNYSSAIGVDNTSTGLKSFAGGINSKSLGNQSFAFGDSAIAMGPYSIAIGKEVTAFGGSSITMGHYLRTTISSSVVIGYGFDDNNCLENSNLNSIVLGCNSNKPTLFIGPSPGLNYSGKVGIGNITAPTAKLHIKADDNENASLKLEPTSFGYEAQILMGDDFHKITAKPNDDLKFSIPSGRNFIFENGKIKTTGFQLANGQQGEGKYLRSDANGNASWANSNVPCLDCLASGQYASTIGMYDTATEIASLAFGYNAKALGSFALAIGKYVTSHGASSVTIGRYLQTNTSPAIILGCGVDNTNRLQNNIPNSLMVGFGSIKSTLFVGPSIGSSNTGKIGIGDVTDPQAKLHIKADQYETASLFIEPYMFGGNYTALLWMGTQEYGLKAAYGRMYFNTGGNYIFNSADAKVGIGTLNPLAKLQVKGDVFIEDVNAGLILKSPDGQCWKITVNNSGELITTSIDCNLTTGAIDLPQPEEKVIRIYPNPAENNITIENTGDNEVFATLRGIDGILITSRKLQTGNNTLNLENLTPGYYIVTILDNKNRVITSEKIIKK